MDCLFCRIIAGEIPSNKVYEDDLVYAFRDIAPQAPTHILVIPKAHLSGVSDITPENSALVAHIFEVIPAIAKAEGLTNGYRVYPTAVPTHARVCRTCISTFWAGASWARLWLDFPGKYAKIAPNRITDLRGAGNRRLRSSVRRSDP